MDTSAPTKPTEDNMTAATALFSATFLDGNPNLWGEALWEEIQDVASHNWTAFDFEDDEDGNTLLLPEWRPVFMSNITPVQREFFDEPFDFTVTQDDLEASGTVTMTPYMYGYMFTFEFVPVVGI
jgi:hypothetical protein